MKPDWPLETERLVLRPFAEGDLDALHAMHWVSEAHKTGEVGFSSGSTA